MKEEEKHKFYPQIQEVVPKREMPILLGVLNVNVRQNNTSHEKVKGLHGLSDEFQVTTGFRQGCLLRILLFLVVLDSIP